MATRGTSAGDYAGHGRGGVEPQDPVLSGITVLDLTQYLAGPSCTRMLMESGADVIKVEFAPYGDPSRSFAPRRNRRSGFFVQQNRGKRSVCVDFTSDEGLALITELATTVDVVVENFTPGVLSRRGLGYDELCSRKPDLIMASISGFGQTGPHADRPAFDFIAQAYSGVMHMTGDPDGPPLFVGMALADTAAGVHAYGAIGHALFRRERTGAGGHLDIAMVDCLVHMQESGVYAPFITDGEYEPMRQGRFYQPAQPGGVYRGPNGWIVIFCAQDQVGGLFRAMGQPRLMDDARFATNTGRLTHRTELTELIETWMSTFPNDDAVLNALAAERVPSSVVASPADLIHDQHLRARDMVRLVPDPRLGQVAVPGFPIHFLGDSAPSRLGPDDAVAPNLGQHNREVLHERLGLTDAEIDRLEASGVLAQKDR